MSASLKDEVRGAAFGDQRLTKRLGKVIEELGAKPTMSVPAATRGRAEMEAAYRFFDNDKVSPEKILQPHIEATRERISQSEVVLLVQDTTDIDLTRPKQQVRGAGPLEYDTRRGVFFHPLLAFNSHGLPLGVAWQKSWARSKIRKKRTKIEKDRWQRKTPIEGKESFRWLEGLRAAREVADACSQTTCVCIADSDADVYELFCESRSTSSREVHFLVRACKNRNTSGPPSNFLEATRAAPCLFQCSVNVSARTARLVTETRKRHETREARIAEIEVRAATVTMRPPYRKRPRPKLPEVTLNVVLAEEPNPPDGATPIQWLLVTTLPIDRAEQVQQIVSYYSIRWQIEIYFRTLKSGCRIENRQFETLDRLLNCLAVYSIIAWKVMYLCRLGHECPDLDCEIIFEPSEWKSVYMTVHQEEPPSTAPSLNEMIRLISSLGGYVIRPSTQPGPQTLWLGLQRVHDLSTAWETFGPS
jgi:hypothetical protein